MGPTNRTPVRGAARLAAILDALPDALLLVDASGAVVNANSAALTLFEGESAERLLGKAIAELLPGFGRTVATPGSGPAALPAGSGTIDPRDLRRRRRCAAPLSGWPRGAPTAACSRPRSPRPSSPRRTSPS